MKNALLLVLLIMLGACTQVGSNGNQNQSTSDSDKDANTIMENLREVYKGEVLLDNGRTVHVEVKDSDISDGIFWWREGRYADADEDKVYIATMRVETKLQQLSPNVEIIPLSSNKSRQLWRIKLKSINGKKSFNYRITSTNTQEPEKDIAGTFDALDEWSFYFDDKSLAEETARAFTNLIKKPAKSN